MRLTRHSAIAIVALLGAVDVGISSCSSESGALAPSPAGPDGAANDDGATPVATDGSVPPPHDAAPDVVEYAVAKGDPCRGVALPTDHHFVAIGMCARAVALSSYPLRQLTFAPNGDLFGVSNGGDVVLFRDTDGDGFFQPDEIHPYATKVGPGNNCHIDGGYIYAGSTDSVVRWPYDPTATETTVPSADVVVGIPSGGHPLHTVHVYDGYLYVHSGSESNATNLESPAYDSSRALLRRFPVTSFASGPVAWTAGEIVTVGLRNMVGFTRNAAGRMFGVVNGLDGLTYQGADIHDDNPGEQVVELGLGRKYGYPFCFTAQRVVESGSVVPPGTQLWNQAFGVHDAAWCAANSMPPATFVQAHSAPLDVLFFDNHPKGALPERWRGGAFISLHGSQNRSISTGYKVIWLPFDAAGNPAMPTSTATDTTFPYETVFGGGTANGTVDGAWSWSTTSYADSPRPVGLAISPVDGALYVASDTAGLVYRVGLAP